jgi:phosphoribosylaminoimidazole carboxylase (NCAIR synthetase)
MNGVGLFGVEFFIRGDDIIFNEAAPRPHNSDNSTIEASSISQFSALFNLGAGAAIPSAFMTSRASGILNLLGTQNVPALFHGEDFPPGSLHFYGKKDSSKGRKMGLFTLLGEDSNSILLKLLHLRSRYQI